MSSFLQINLNCCKAANALALQQAVESNVAFLIVSEPCPTRVSTWFYDALGKAAIACLRGHPVDVILKRLLTSGAGVIVEWMASMGLELALHKSEAMVITNSRTHNDMRITIKGTEIATVPCIKYLGIHLDAKLNFTTHAMYVSAKASKVAANLARILPNISQAKPRKRRLLSGVVHSILLYGAPVWADRMSQSGIRELGKCQRRIALRVASAYCSVSADAVLVIADIPPIDLLAKERMECFNHTQLGTERDPNRTSLLNSWQARWESSIKGRWTFQLIPDLKLWFQRSHGEVNFHMTQALSGHGCFSSYLHRIGKLDSPACWYCEAPSDDALHTLFFCDAWYSRR